MERLRVRLPAGKKEEFSSAELTFCTDSYSVSVPPRVNTVARKRPRSFCHRYKWYVTPNHAYVLDPTKSEWDDYAVRAKFGNALGKATHTQLVRDHSVTVV